MRYNFFLFFLITSCKANLFKNINDFISLTKEKLAFSIPLIDGVLLVAQEISTFLYPVLNKDCAANCIVIGYNALLT